MKNRYTVQNGARKYVDLRKPNGIYLNKINLKYLLHCYIIRAHFGFF